MPTRDVKNLHDWLLYLEGHYGKNRGSEFAEVDNLAARLGINDFACPVITVAGTNGKGSCAAFLESILLAAGYRVAVYTSPHLIRFTERVRICGTEVSANCLCEAFNFIDGECRELSLSYFAVITLVALYLFSQTELDVVVLEVGLGGRLDPVNVVSADIAVITTIALDHVDRLGDDREKIGFEKAGIFRKSRPVVCGDPNPPSSLLKYAKSLMATVYSVNEDFYYGKYNGVWRWRDSKRCLDNLPLPKLPLPNAATALMVLELLQAEIPVSEDSICAGLAKAFLLARMQVLLKNPRVILDVAHNEESAGYLAQQLAMRDCRGRTLAVVGMLKDKDISAVFRALLNQVDVWYCGSLSVSRGATAEYLVQILHHLGVNLCYSYGSVIEALNRGIVDCESGDRIVVFGSFYTAANVLEVYGEN